MIVFKWFFVALLSCGAIALGVRLAGRDVAWAGRHLGWLVCAAFALTVMTMYAETKPEPPPGPPPGPGPTPGGETNEVVRIRVGKRPDGAIVPYGAPLKEVRE